MRAERLHHRARLRANRRLHWGRDLRQEPAVLSQVVDADAVQLLVVQRQDAG